MVGELEFAYGEHAGRVREDCDWGGPCDYTAYCDCGWRGTTLGDVLHTDGSGTIGGRYDSFVELLDHMGVSIEEYVEFCEFEINRHLGNIVTTVAQINKFRDRADAMRRKL